MDVAVIEAVLDRLSRVFHKEADFQQAMAWRLHQHFPALTVRAEYPVQDYSLDLWLADETATMAVELKYPKRRFTARTDTEAFALGNDLADVGCYEYLVDITRLESLVAAGQCDYGAAVILTNNSLFWENQPSGTIYDDLMVYDGRTLSGTLAWAEEASLRASQDREITLQGEYDLARQDYAYQHPATATGHTEFKYCVTSVSPRD